MKRSIVAIAAIATMSSALVAGGTIQRIPEPVPQKVPTLKDYSGPYVGGGYTFGTADVIVDGPDFGFESTKAVDSITFLGGYDFNKYVAVEGRYNFGLDDTFEYGKKYVETISMDTFSALVKPQYPVTNDISVYGLIGYSWMSINSDYASTVDIDGITWGLGAEYAVAENVEVFVDYTNLYSDSYVVETVNVNEDIYNVTLGVKYNF